MQMQQESRQACVFKQLQRSFLAPNGKNAALQNLQERKGYDQRSGVNSIRVVNPKLSEQAAAKDDELRKASLASNPSLMNDSVMKRGISCIVVCPSEGKKWLQSALPRQSNR